jgi:hypothetical protein
MVASRDIRCSPGAGDVEWSDDVGMCIALYSICMAKVEMAHNGGTFFSFTIIVPEDHGMVPSMLLVSLCCLWVGRCQ